MPILFKKIADERDLRGKKVLLRLDLNVPIDGGLVRDDFRIARSLPTLRMLRERGARTIVVSHIESAGADSLAPVAEYIARSIDIKAFAPSLAEAPEAVRAMRDGDIVILENIRHDAGEKANDQAFARRLASLADIYVNDAFAVSHREHASIVSVPKLLPSFAGPLLAEEIEQLSKAFNPPHPFLFILGGAKFDTKLPLIEKFLGIADHVLIGGALANDIYREKGYEVGQSVVATSRIDLGAIAANKKLMVPEDVVVSSAAGRLTRRATEVRPDEKIMDAGPQSIDDVADLLKTAKFVLWNGPLGLYEKGFTEGTERLARAIAASRARSVIGGGDTIAAVAKIGMLDRFGFVSTGGGAMLEFLAKGTLPGIEALRSE